MNRCIGSRSNQNLVSVPAISYILFSDVFFAYARRSSDWPSIATFRPGHRTSLQKLLRRRFDDFGRRRVVV